VPEFNSPLIREHLLDGGIALTGKQRGEYFLESKDPGDLGDFVYYIGCKVGKGAPDPPPSNFTRIPIPRAAIVEAG
jgi:hypothetical protein